MQQRTLPNAFDNTYSVIDLLTNGSGTADVGTGSIIGSMVDPTTDIGYFCVLTAAHNFPSSTAIGFGDFGRNGNNANSFADTYPIVSVQTGGSTGKKDLAVAMVKYGPVDDFFDDVQDLSLWAAPAISDSALQTYVTSGTTAINSFTEIGYGNTGTPHYTSGVQDGFIPQDSTGIQRFQNNTRSGVNVDAAHGAYTYTDFTWTPGPVSPGNPNLGTGSSFMGDSGGPYLLSSPTTLTIAGLTDVFGNAVGNQNITLNTDSIFAVHTFGDNNNPQLFSDANITSGGVLLTAADETWIESVCVVPEPSTLVLLIVACATGLWFRGRRPSPFGHK
ncbi:MAG: PEP-CTERM sorting domain-containing protein [Thermoguttaceae bacterium]